MSFKGKILFLHLFLLLSSLFGLSGSAKAIALKDFAQQSDHILSSGSSIGQPSLSHCYHLRFQDAHRSGNAQILLERVHRKVLPNSPALYLVSDTLFFFFSANEKAHRQRVLAMG